MWMTHLSSNRKVKSKPSWNTSHKVDPVIKFTVEDNQENDTIPFLDTLVKPETDNTTIHYSLQESHTDQYLQWDRHHNLVAKYSVISTLTHRTRTVCTKPELLNKEIQHLKKALSKCKYPKWALDMIERKFTNRSQANSNAEPRAEDSNSPSSNIIERDPIKVNTVRDI